VRLATLVQNYKTQSILTDLRLALCEPHSPAARI